MRTPLSMVYILLLSLLGTVALQAETPAPPGPNDKPYGPGIVADQIREGDLPVGKDYTMSLGGRFHIIHAKYMALKCATCHAGVVFPENIQYLRREEFPLAAYPGAVDRSNCIACHSGEGALASQIYGVEPK